MPMRAEYTPEGRELGPILGTFMLRAVGQPTRLQRTEYRYGISDLANGSAGTPAICPARLLVVTVQVAACLLSSCAGPADLSVTPPPDVLLVTIDTLRADRVGSMAACRRRRQTGPSGAARRHVHGRDGARAVDRALACVDPDGTVPAAP